MDPWVVAGRKALPNRLTPPCGVFDSRLKDDETRKIRILGAQSVVNPGPGTGIAEERKSRVHEKVALGMFAEIGGHAPNHSELVDLLGDVGEEIGQFDPDFP